MKIFSVFDSKAETYSTPMVQRNSGEAIRSFQTAVNDNKTQFHAYPEDFTLVELAEWIETEGVIKPLPKPKILINASEFKRD